MTKQRRTPFARSDLAYAWCAVLATFLTLHVAAPGARGEPVRDKHVEAELISEVSSIQPGKPFTVGVHFEIDPSWHTYWINPGAAGLPTKVTWELPEGFTAGPLEFPYPHKFESAGSVGFGYEKEATHLVEITPPGDLPVGNPVTLKGKVSWLMCDPSTCVPGKADLALELPVSADAPGEGADAAKIRAARAQLPVTPEGWTTKAEVQDGKLVVTVNTGGDAGLENRPTEGLGMYALEQGLLAYGQPMRFAWEDDRTLKVEATLKEGVTELAEPFGAVLVSKESPFGGGLGQAVWIGDAEDAAEKDPAVEAAAMPTDSAGLDAALALDATETPFGGFLGVLLAGFVGGLILNVMPCVFPVISLKIMSFVSQAGESRTKMIMHGLIFTLGILVFFWALTGALLGLRAGGEQLGWAFQFQSPIFNMVMAAIMVVLAMSLFGVFEMGASLTGVGGSLSMKSGYAGSFWSGALATLLATPCTGPFLGTSIGFILSKSPGAIILFFTIMGLGMALPYILLAAFPVLLRFVPRPGAWMETFKQAMGFPMLATAVWLLWVLNSQVGGTGLAFFMLALVFLAIAVWAWGRFLSAGSGKRSKAAGWATLLIALACSIAVAKKSVGYKPESAARVDDIAALIEKHQAEGKHVFLDFTATWCLICQANKRVMHAPDIEKAFEEHNVAFEVIDFTNEDPEIYRFLQKYGREGVPFYPIFPADPSKEPVVLPQVLTKGVVLNALEQLDEMTADKGGAAATPAAETAASDR